MKTITRKLLYPVILVGMVLIAVLTIMAGVRPIYLLLVALGLFLSARLANYQLRYFYRGLQAFQQRDLAASEANFRIFLADAERRPWIKKLMWLSWGSYTGDIEAMGYNNLGAICLETRRLEEAKTCLQKALSLDANYAKPHYNLAVIAVLQNDAEASKLHFEETRRLGFTNSAFDQFLTKVQTDYADFNVKTNDWLKKDSRAQGK